MTRKKKSPSGTYKMVNPLPPKSNQYLTSPYTPESRIKVARIMEIIIN